MKVTDITPEKHKTLKQLQDYIAICANVVRDKQPKSAEKLFNRLLTESVGDEPSRVLEYIPCVIDKSEITHLLTDYNADTQLFGFFNGEHYFTNLRELLNMGWNLRLALDAVDFTHYKVFQCETPYFIYGQLSTHNQLTTVSHSQRYADCDRGYWKPPEIGHIAQKLWDEGVSAKWRPVELRELMKKNGITRKEVFDRGKDMLQNRVFTIGGFTNNVNAWDHFLEQRLDSHTQLETREFVAKIDDLLSDITL